MKWLKAELLGLQEIGVDELGNAINELVVVKNVEIREMPYTDSEISIDDRTLMKSISTYLIKGSVDKLPRFTAIRLGGKPFEVVEIARLNHRFTSISVKTYGVNYD